eukprot:5803482-Pyramimonas_sp.AAC.1
MLNVTIKFKFSLGRGKRQAGGVPGRSARAIWTGAIWSGIMYYPFGGRPPKTRRQWQRTTTRGSA